MATSSGRLAAAALDALVASGVRFAVLHKEGAVADGEIGSDIDVVVDEDPRVLLKEAGPAFHAAGLHPVAFWPYDVAWTGTIFLACSDASEGVQLDMLSDPLGRGKYGVRSTILLDAARQGRRWPRITREHELLYLLRKRSVKHDLEQVAFLRQRLKDESPELLASEMRRLFRPSAAESMAQLMNRPSPSEAPRRVWRRRVLDVFRQGRRLARPVGYWVEVVGERRRETACEIAERFRRFLPVVSAEPSPPSSLRRADWWIRTISPVRMRPGLFVSWTDRRRHPAADLTVNGTTADDACADVVSAMESRLLP